MLIRAIRCRDWTSFHCKVVPVSSGKYSPLATLEFRRLEKRDKLDLFHCPFYAAPLLRCPVVVTVHDLIPFLFPIYFWPKQKMVQAGYRAAAKRAAHLIADSHRTATDLQKILGVAPDRISTVHLAADRNIFHPSGGEDEEMLLRKQYRIKKPFVLVSSARNWRTKNLGSALLALESVRKRDGHHISNRDVWIHSKRRNFEIDDSLNVHHVGYVGL